MSEKIQVKKSLFQFSVMCCISVIIVITQFIAKGVSVSDTLPGMFIMTCAAMVALILKDLFPKSIFPAFGWATIIGLLISMPYNPMSVFVNEHTKNISLIVISTPILAFAGVSVGNKINELKRMSWKIFLISCLVFTTIFFACASIAQIVLTLQGTI